MVTRVLLALLVGLLLTPAAAAGAEPATDGATAGDGAVQQADPAEYGLEVAEGYGERTVAGAWTPVEVTLAPSRPVAATLVLEVAGTTGARVRHEQEVEVAGGARTTYRFVLPGGVDRVLLVEGDLVAEVRPAALARQDVFLVGRLGDGAGGAPPLRSAPSNDEGEWVPVDAAWLDEPMALDPLTALVADASALAALGGDARAHLSTAVAAGLQLVVVAEGEGPVDAAGLGGGAAVLARGDGSLDVDGPARRVRVGGEVRAAVADHGLGRVVRAVAGPGGPGDVPWSRLVAAPDAGVPQEWDLRSSPYQLGRILTDGAGGGVPTVPWLAAYLAAYILVVGPVNGLVLGRLRRRELAWVTVPLVTAVFTAAAFVGVSGTRPAVGRVARAVWAVDGSAEEVLAVGLRTPRAATRDATLPGDGWAVDVLLDGGPGGAVVRPTAGGTRATVALGALQLGGVLASRPSDELLPLGVEATAPADGGPVEVRVTNTGDRPLDGVAVRAALTSRRIGALAPGEEQVVEVAPRGVPGDPYRDLLDGIALDGVGGAAGGPGLPATLEAVLRGRVLDGDPGVVWAVATRPAGAPSGVTVDGEPATDEGTLLAVGTRPVLADRSVVPALAVARDLLVADTGWRPGPQAVEGSEAVLRYRFPADARPQVVTGDLGRGNGFDDGLQVTLEVWDTTAGAWVPLDEGLPPAGAAPGRVLDGLGQLHVRATGELFPFEFAGRVVEGGAS